MAGCRHVPTFLCRSLPQCHFLCCPVTNAVLVPHWQFRCLALFALKSQILMTPLLPCQAVF